MIYTMLLKHSTIHCSEFPRIQLIMHLRTKKNLMCYILVFVASLTLTPNYFTKKENCYSFVSLKLNSCRFYLSPFLYPIYLKTDVKYFILAHPFGTLSLSLFLPLCSIFKMYVIHMCSVVLNSDI